MISKSKRCGHIWWVPHIIPGQPCEGDACPIEKRSCVLEPKHEEDYHQSKEGDKIKKEVRG